MWKSLVSNMLTLFLVALVVLGGVIAWGQREFRGEGPLESAICLRVAPGANIRQVSARLAEDGAISDARIFRIGADYTDKASQLKFGSYLIAPGSSMEAILDQITQGGQSTCGTEIVYRIGVTRSTMQVLELDPETQEDVELARFDPGADEEIPSVYNEMRESRDTRYRVVVAEGTTTWQVVDSLSRADFLSGNTPPVPPEGTIAPDSYEVRSGDDRTALVGQMVERQAQILEEVWAARSDAAPVETAEEALILASIIEKETGIPDERGLVAAVFANRLRQGMRLQTDPTVIYGITEGKSVLGRGLRQSELRRATPYNTYVIDGLPPTPIANPGRASLEAAVAPEESEYLFFVADGSGGHAFARTLEEHNRNVIQWRNIERERAAQENAQ